MALKPLTELNREYIIERVVHYQSKAQEPIVNPPVRECSAERTGNKKRGTIAIISDILFYMALLIILFSVLTPSNNGFPKAIMGYSYFSVLSSSMQDEIPKDSFILVRQTDPQKLEVGDNITYVRDQSGTVTHKIVDIYDNYQNSGYRGFQTQGVNNAIPDKEIVKEANVVGKVIFVLPAAGAVISYLGANIHIVFIFFGLCVGISFVLRGLLAKTEKKKISETP